ncbi:MAG: phenylalanine--tRNA ligase subunit beta [Cardiobacteriaceae bacterium]|nr:phenylalanine--tRNA ligase subunit beta [Cardiobacteriaceae bacterium]
MLLSLEWLADIYGIRCDKEQLAHRLTMSGLEIDDILPVAPEFQGVIVAEVSALEKHPDADKLNIAQVYTGHETLQIVCGAPNVAVGIKVPLATIGAKLPNDLSIKKGKLRGVESFGMLCSARELGLSDEASGLMILPDDAPVGEDIRNYLKLHDVVLDINVTPNRGDCLSLRGLAREIAVIFPEIEAKTPNLQSALPPLSQLKPSTLTLHNHAPQACPFYSARKITGVNAKAKTPEAMKMALERSGIRTHSAIVDVTNYVMLLLGTPLHAFDAHKVEGGIHIRMAKADETLVLLNENKALLSSDMLLIADERKALAVAGVMGGLESACQEDTCDIILESAWFDPVTIAGKARALTVSSDSAQRFERGVDFTLQQSALDLATQWILHLCGGEAEEAVVVQHELPKRPTITLAYDAIEKCLGRCYPHEQIINIFKRLGCEIKSNEQQYQVTPPSFRFDLHIPEDLIEEIARIDGYENIARATPSFPYQSALPHSSLDKAADALSTLGYHEIITYSFIDPKVQQTFFPNNQAIDLQNPISAHLAQMRLSLIPALVQTVQYNRNRQEPNVKLFEIGRVFLELDQQPYRIAGALSGLATAEQWSHSKRGVDFYDAKAAVEYLIGTKAHYTPSQSAFLHPNKSADIWLKGEKVGIIGALHPECLKALGIKGGEIYVFELEAKALCGDRLVTYQSLNKFPSVRRDLSFVLDKQLNIGDVILDIQRIIGNRLRECYCFDIFSDKALGEKQSVSFALIFQDEKTLNDQEVEQMIAEIIEQLQKRFAAELR